MPKIRKSLNDWTLLRSSGRWQRVDHGGRADEGEVPADAQQRERDPEMRDVSPAMPTTALNEQHGKSERHDAVTP